MIIINETDETYILYCMIMVLLLSASVVDKQCEPII